MFLGPYNTDFHWKVKLSCLVPPTQTLKCLFWYKYTNDIFSCSTRGGFRRYIVSRIRIGRRNSNGTCRWQVDLSVGWTDWAYNNWCWYAGIRWLYEVLRMVYVLFVILFWRSDVTKLTTDWRRKSSFISFFFFLTSLSNAKDVEKNVWIYVYSFKVGIYIFKL